MNWKWFLLPRGFWVTLVPGVGTYLAVHWAVSTGRPAVAILFGAAASAVDVWFRVRFDRAARLSSDWSFAPLAVAYATGVRLLPAPSPAATVGLVAILFLGYVVLHAILGSVAQRFCEQ